MNQNKGFLITFEGGDGAGKTTLIEKVIPYFEKQYGLKIVTFREPGATRIGEQIRTVVHNKDNEEMSDRAELLLYLASRAQNVEQNIKPALEEGKIVLLDRFGDSSIAYQGLGRGLGGRVVSALNRFATCGIEPNFTLLFDVDPEVGLRRRVEEAGAEWNRLDAEKLEFHQTVRRAYLSLASNEGRFVIVDANQGFDEVFDRTKRLLETRLGLSGFIERPTVRGERE